MSKLKFEGQLTLLSVLRAVSFPSGVALKRPNSICNTHSHSVFKLPLFALATSSLG